MLLSKKNFYPLLMLAIPLAMTGLLQSGVFFFETVFLARLGPEVLAAGSLVSWLVVTIAVILFGTLSSINILVAYKHGARDAEGIAEIVRDGLKLALLLALPISILYWNISPLLLLFGQSPAIVLLAKSYLHAIAFGILPNVITIALLEVIIGLGHARIVLVASLFSVALTIFFSFSLIFGKFGMPALGIAGAGWGITVSYWITALFLFWHVLTSNQYKRFFQHLFMSNKVSHVMELLRIGLPMGIMYSVEVGFFFAITLIIGTFDGQLLAANQIALQYMGTLMSVIFSIAQAITVRMGHLLGASDTRAAKHAGIAGMWISALLMMITAICYWLFPTALISIDFDIHIPGNAGLIKDATQFLAVAAVFQIVESVRIALFGALRGLKETRFPLLVSIISFWGIALPIGYILATRWHLGGPGLWWGMVLGASFSIVLLWYRFKFKIRQYGFMQPDDDH